MLLPTTEPMITSMSQMILDRAGLRLLVTSTADLTISGKNIICSQCSVHSMWGCYREVIM